MNELDLIREVEKRAILYDKSVSGFNKTKLRDDAWKEVQEALHVSESECKKRWRSLRDSFIKLQRTHGGRTRWPYHQAMRFLLPHVEPPSAPKPSDFEVPVFQDHSEESEEDEKIRCLPDLSFAVIDPARVTQLSEEEDDEPPPKKTKEVEEDNGLICQCLRTDPDELFLLSCSSTLKRLNAKQNAVARLKIQQLLVEAEFGATGAGGVAGADMPYIVTAAAGVDCQYDNLEDTQ